MTDQEYKDLIDESVRRLKIRVKEDAPNTLMSSLEPPTMLGEGYFILHAPKDQNTEEGRLAVLHELGHANRFVPLSKWEDLTYSILGIITPARLESETMAWKWALEHYNPTPRGWKFIHEAFSSYTNDFRYGPLPQDAAELLAEAKRKSK